MILTEAWHTLYVPKLFSNYFLTFSGSVRQEKLNIKDLFIT
jgi:hypothetical protein